MESDKSSWRKAWHLSSHMPQKNLEGPLAHTCIQLWNTEKRNRNLHVARLTWAPSGKRKRGMPRKTWTRTVEWERPELGLSGWWATGLTLWTAAAAVAKNRDKKENIYVRPYPTHAQGTKLGTKPSKSLTFCVPEPEKFSRQNYPILYVSRKCRNGFANLGQSSMFIPCRYRGTAPILWHFFVTLYFCSSSAG